MTVQEAATAVGFKPQKVQRLAQTGKIPGACKVGGDWVLPDDSASIIAALPRYTRQASPPVEAGILTPVGAAKELGVTTGYVCQLAAWRLAPGAYKAARSNAKHPTWHFPPEAIAFMRRYLGAKPAERATMRTQDNGEMPVLRIAEPGPEATALAEQVWAWHRGRP